MSIKSDKWIRRMAQEHGMIEPFVERQMREPGPDEVKKAAREHVANRLKLAATKLGSNDFMLGSSFSVVDAYLFVMLRWSKKNEVEVPSELGSYFDRLQSRPSVKRALEEEGLTS